MECTRPLFGGSREELPDLAREEHASSLSWGNCPDFSLAAIRHDEERLPIGAICHEFDHRPTADEDLLRLPCRHVPEDRRLIAAATGQHATIGAEGEGADVAGVAEEGPA